MVSNAFSSTLVAACLLVLGLTSVHVPVLGKELKPEEIPQKDFYELLNVKKTATLQDIKRSFRKLSMKWHPDKNKAPDAHKRFTELSVAFQILTDPTKRKMYDKYGPKGPMGDGAFDKASEHEAEMRERGGPGPGAFFDGFMDPGELFAQMFGGGGPGGPGGPIMFGPGPGGDFGGEGPPIMMTPDGPMVFEPMGGPPPGGAGGPGQQMMFMEGPDGTIMMGGPPPMYFHQGGDGPDHEHDHEHDGGYYEGHPDQHGYGPPDGIPMEFMFG